MTGVTANGEAGTFRQILGVRFFTGSAKDAVCRGLRGGLVVAPSAPGLVDLTSDASYREALTNADTVLTDSGFMILVWRLLRREQIPRVSGRTYIKLLLESPALWERGDVFWVMPTVAAQTLTLAWLRGHGRPADEEDFYVAPFYGPDVQDATLLEHIERRQPAHIVIGISGGVQEKLGLYLKMRATYRPGIHCIGAAIGFLTGDQKPIPDWADRFFLGWLLRCIYEPRKLIPRIWKARKLLGILLKYRERSPAVKAA